MEAAVSSPIEQREKRRVALVSLLACLVLVVSKTIVGVASNSLGVLSEAASSGLDLIATIITYVSIRLSDKPADADHPYGHGKIESVSALVESGLLLVACAWIVKEAAERLFGGGEPVHATPVVFAVLVFSMAVDFFRARALARVARTHRSQALEADALHFSIDFWTSGTVLVGIACVALAGRTGVAWLRHGDSLAALAVAGTILVLIFGMGKRSVEALIDTAPPGLKAQVEEATASVDGVLSVDRVRTRRSGNRTFIDLTIGVPRTLPFERVHAIADRVEEAVRSRTDQPDVTVHAEPRAHAGESLFEQVRAIAQGNDLLVHELSAHDMDAREGASGRMILDLDAEVDEGLTLREAHALVDRVEKEIYRQIPSIGKINIHLETLGQRAVPASSLQDLSRALEAHWRDVHRRFPEVLDCHDFQVRLVEGRIVASCHATLEGSLSVRRAHDITQEIEDATRRRFPQIFRVTIHTEPPEAH